MLPILAAHLEESDSDTNLNAGILSETQVHLLSLIEEFSRYFPDIASNPFHLVKSPFTFDAAGVPKKCTQRNIKMMTQASNSRLPFWNLSFGFVGSWITLCFRNYSVIPNNLEV
jgi:hypothetical protein